MTEEIRAAMAALRSGVRLSVRALLAAGHHVALPQGMADREWEAAIKEGARDAFVDYVEASSVATPEDTRRLAGGFAAAQGAGVVIALLAEHVYQETARQLGTVGHGDGRVNSWTDGVVRQDERSDRSGHGDDS